VEKALEWLKDGSVDGKLPDLVSLYFSEVDEAGHRSGHRSQDVRLYFT